MTTFTDKIYQALEVLPPCKERLKSLPVSERSTPFAITLYDVEGLREQYFAEISGKTDKPSRLHLRLSLFDHEFGLFFGKTWSTPLKTYRGQSGINFNKSVFFHSSVDREKLLLVLELVASWSNIDDEDEDDSSDFHVSCGWGACLAFQSGTCTTEFGASKRSSISISRIDLYSGTPRVLFYNRDFTEFQKGHPTTRISVSLSTRFHRQLDQILHLIPENVFFADAEDVPGIQAAAGLKRPEPCMPLKSSLEKIEVKLLPNLVEFEETFLRLIHEDFLQASEDSTLGLDDISIGRRTLRVGVHNGQTFVGPLEDIQMLPSSDVLVKGMSRKLSTKSSGQKRSVVSMAAAILQGSKADGESLLVHSTKIEVEGMMKDPSFHFVFALVYEILLPNNAEGDNLTKRPSAQPVVEVLVRWGVSGLQGESGALGQGRREVMLRGGPVPNPFGIMAYTSKPPTSNENMSSNVRASEAGEVLRFTLQTTEGPLQFLQHQAGDYDSGFRASRMPLVPLAGGSAAKRLPTPSKLPSKAKEKQEREDEDEDEEEDEEMEDIKVKSVSKSPDVKSSKVAPPATDTSMAPAVETSELKELPYASVQVPILPAFPARKRDATSNGLSRAAFAQLLTLKFPVVLGADGMPAEVVDPRSLPYQMLPEKDYEDPLRANEIVLQFMAFSRVPTTDEFNSIEPPNVLFFTFQFYRFELLTSERLLLEVVDKEISANGTGLLHVLRRLDVDGTLLKCSPGCQVRFIVDSSGQAEGREFYKYLSEQFLHIDVWDADSLFHVGECLLDLKVLMRQGRPSIQATLELDVLHTEYVEPEMVVTDAVVSTEAVAKPIEITTSQRGKLLLRVGNIGRKLDSVTPKRAFPVGQELSISTVASMIKKSRANRLPDVSCELLQMILNQKCPSNIVSSADRGAERTKKMRRMEALKKKLTCEEEDKCFPVASLRLETELRQRDLKTVEMYRENAKAESIRSLLCRQITMSLVIRTSLGTTSFFEFPLRNPRNIESLVLIEWEDPDLSLVTNDSEWRHFKTINNISTPLEEGLFSSVTAKSTSDASLCTARVAELLLRPKETVHVPFKFLTFRHLVQVDSGGFNFASSSMLTSDQLADDVDDDNVVERDLNGDEDEVNSMKREKSVNVNQMERSYSHRNAKVTFKIKNDMTLLAMLDLTIKQQPHIINQTFRLTQPEQTFLKKSFRLPQWTRLTGTHLSSGQSQIYVRCSDPNVICTASAIVPGQPVDIFVKVACGAAPQLKNFFVAIYTDPRLSKPLQIWQLYIRVMQRVDIAAVQGQTVRFTLMIRGGLASRLVRCHPSHPRQMSISPDEPFMLLAGNLQQINVGIRPAKVGVSSMFVNVVDMESHQLVTSWLVHAITQEPIIGKQFEIDVTVGGPGENKRISFINPYGYRKTFHLRTTHERLLLFRESRLELEATQRCSIGMRFAPAERPGRVTILVFVDDDEGKNEETFAVRVNYRRSR